MGRLVGATGRKTPNRVSLADGKEGNLSCAGDILLTGLYGDLHGDSTCPVCGRTIELEIRGRKVVRLSPPGAQLHYVRAALPDPSAFGIECESTFLFDQNECLNEWKSRHTPSGQVKTPQDFLDEVVSVKGLGTGRSKGGE